MSQHSQDDRNTLSVPPAEEKSMHLVYFKPQYPTYPSARVTVGVDRYKEAVATLEGIPQVFFDGETILLPESEYDAIEQLRSRFDVVIETDCGREWEFATKARAEGVLESLVSLGNAVWHLTGQSADEMVQSALDHPRTTITAWRTLYLAHMKAH